MELRSISFYWLCDYFLISEGWLDDPQCTMGTAAAFFSGSYEKIGELLERHRYIPASA